MRGELGTVALHAPDLSARLRGTDGAIGVGLGLDAIELFVNGACEAASTADPWHLLVASEIADELSYEFVIATEIEDLRGDGRLELHETTQELHESVVVTDEAAFAFAGRTAEPYALETTRESTVAGLHTALLERFTAGRCRRLDEPGREELLTSACETLRPGFANDLRAALAGARRLPRSDRTNALTLLLIVGARHDHLFRDVRSWSQTVGVAHRQMYIDVKDDLVGAGLVETVKIPSGSGRPPLRLRLHDADLEECPATELVPTMRWKLGDRVRAPHNRRADR